MKKILFLLFVPIWFQSILFGQATWNEIPTPITLTEGRFDDIFFLNENLGWAVSGSPGYVFKTENGGQSWYQQFQTLEYHRNIEFIDENIGFLGTLSNKFYRTSNGGQNWTIMSMPSAVSGVCGIDAVGSSTVYACGAYYQPAFVIKSTDAGLTWQYIDLTAQATALVEIQFLNEQVGFCSGKSSQGGTILKTIDGGQTWTEIYNSNTPGDYVWKLQLMEDENMIFGSIQSAVQGKLIKSYDFGENWVEHDFVDDFVQAVGFISPTHGWMGGHNTTMHETVDGGQTWTDLHLNPSLNRFVVFGPQLVYAAGRSIFKLQSTTGIINLEELNEIEDNIEVKIVLNPIGNSLKFNVQFNHPDHLIAEVYSSDGKLLNELINDQIFEKGDKQYTFDFNYSTGNYILNIHTNHGRRSIPFVKR